MTQPAETPAPAIVTTWSASIKHLAPALLIAQRNMEGPRKDAQNPHLKNKYASLAATLEAVIPPLNAAGVLFLQEPEQLGTVDEITVVTELVHAESGEWKRCRLTLPVSKNDAQGVGSAITYARRYSAQCVCGVAPEDDDGEAASKRKPSGQWRGAGPADEAPKDKPPTADELLAAIKGAKVEGDLLNVAPKIKYAGKHGTMAKDAFDAVALAYKLRKAAFAAPQDEEDEERKAIQEEGAGR